MVNPIVIVQAEPGAMSAQTAAAYLEVGEAAFRKLVQTYPEHLKPFNLVPKGDSRWSKEQLDKYLAWRKVVGKE